MSFPTSDTLSQRFAVDVIEARAMSGAVRTAWQSLRAANPALWSPYFDIRMFDVLSHTVTNAQVGVAYDRARGDIIAIFPFQGKRGGLARPLGAPLSDQHDMIAAPDCAISLNEMMAMTGMSGFIFSGLLQPIDGALKSEVAMCHVADLGQGLDDYLAWRKANWNDQVKKNARRIRQGEKQWGPMRIETACPNTSNHFETLMAWKQAKYVETNRHNVLAVPWVQETLRTFYHSPDPNFRGEITLLYFGDHLAALEFGLRADGAMHSWFPAFDRAYAQVSPGILLMDGMIEACAARGITKVDLGIGHDQYKRHASNAPKPVWAGTYPIAPVRRVAAKAFHKINDWAQAHLPETQGAIMGKLQRRHEMILASEPTLKGRYQGYIAAIKAI